MKDPRPTVSGVRPPEAWLSPSEALTIIQTPILLDGEASDLWTWEAEAMACPITGRRS